MYRARRGSQALMLKKTLATALTSERKGRNFSAVKPIFGVVINSGRGLSHAVKMAAQAGLAVAAL